MGYSKGKITKPVSVADVKQALGASSNDVFTLCEHGNINVWAKYRPLPLEVGVNDTPGVISESLRKKYNYGLIARASFGGNIDAMYEELADVVNMADFDYSMVTVRKWNENNNPKQYHRLADFDGYDHTAKLEMNKTDATVGTLCDSEITPTFGESERSVTVVGSETKKIRLHVDTTIIQRFLAGNAYEQGSGDGITALNLIYQSGATTIPDDVVRGVFLYKKMGGDKWVIAARKARSDNNAADSIAALTAGQCIDLQSATSGSIESREYIYEGKTVEGKTVRLTWKELEGNYLVVDYYWNSNYGMPIPSLCYNINITRLAAGSDVLNIEGVTSFALLTPEVYDDGTIVVGVEYWVKSGSTLQGLYDDLQVVISSDAKGNSPIKGNSAISFYNGTGETGLMFFNCLYTKGSTEKTAYAVLKGRKKTATSIWVSTNVAIKVKY